MPGVRLNLRAVNTMSKAVDAMREENSKLRGRIEQQNRAIEENRAEEKGSCLQM